MSKAPFVYKKFFQRLCDIFHQETFTKIRGERCKLRTYAIFKKEPGLEQYLSEIKNLHMRINVTKFRLSNHKLMIETGRIKKIENAEERFCPFCPESVENEFHFLFSCQTYHPLRSDYLTPITSQVHGFFFWTDNQKLEYIMSCMEQNTCKFISNCLDIREFLINNPKRHQ